VLVLVLELLPHRLLELEPLLLRSLGLRWMLKARRRARVMLLFPRRRLRVRLLLHHHQRAGLLLHHLPLETQLSLLPLLQPTLLSHHHLHQLLETYLSLSPKPPFLPQVTLLSHRHHRHPNLVSLHHLPLPRV
jgi:hypothetical protein